MATKKVQFDGVRFGVSTLEDALSLMKSISGDDAPNFRTLEVQVGSAEWNLDSVHEFYSKSRLEHAGSTFSVKSSGANPIEIRIRQHDLLQYSSVTITNSEIAVIERLMEVFESAAPQSIHPHKPATEPFVPTVFIGHGGASQEWRELEQYLRNHMGINATAYEVEPRGGDDIRNVLDEMFTASDFALLVMTAEDQQPDGTLRARQNVIHETGLAQGRLGWKRAVVLLENGSEDYSNLGGIQQIRFDKGAISAAFGSVIATLKREFPRL